ncbi:MAG: hypothetical protein NZ455_10070 [Bacteroidia bacterium]|nr:hypothetical protein [Bacteroidia bacterium]
MKLTLISWSKFLYLILLNLKMACPSLRYVGTDNTPKKYQNLVPFFGCSDPTPKIKRIIINFLVDIILFGYSNSIY